MRSIAAKPRGDPLPFLFLALDVPLRLLAAALAASLLYASLHDVSQAYDVWYYHLPFAARLAGIMDASTYAFSADNIARYEGFPLFAELLQGLLWRITGHVQSTNLVALFSLFGLVVFLWRLFKVPLHLTLIALLAIPLVQMHCTSSYVDLPANVCVTMLLLLVYRMLEAGNADDAAAPSTRTLIACAALAAMAANSKFQLVPIVIASGAVILVVCLRRRMTKGVAIIALAAPIIFTTPIENLAVHGNPVWPVELHALGHSFPFVERAYSQSPPHLETSPRPIRFAHSVLELDNRPIASHARWSFDQWAPSSDPSCRMGGYFGAYAAINLLALGLAAVRLRSREGRARRAALLFAGVTVVASLVPQSHELRYYMHWMILLVALNLVVWCGSAKESGEDNKKADSEPAKTHLLLAGAVALAAFAVFVWSSEGVYLYASGSTFAQYVDKRVEKSVINSITEEPTERLCISRQPFTFLYAPKFHPEKKYAVQEATRATDCKTSRIIDPFSAED